MTYRHIKDHPHEFDEVGRIATPSGFELSVARCEFKYCAVYSLAARRDNATAAEWADIQAVAIAALNAWQQRGLMNDPDATIGGPDEH